MKTLKSTLKVASLGLQIAKSPTVRIRGRARMTRNARLAWRNPLCVECERLGIPKAAEEWDHIIRLSDGGTEEDSNLQGLCREHHEAKTNAENARDRGVGWV